MTSADTDSRLRPVAIQGDRGPLLGVYRPPVATATAQGDVLVIPAFAEEMNRCRSMVCMQAQALAELGFGTLVLDPHGTGDSPGEFDEGSWESWRADLQRGVDWLRQHGQGCRALWGVRLGALMAAEIAADDPGIDRLLLWVPVVAGKPYWTQFLRIRIAAEMALANGVKSTDELRQRSARGEVVEASGYAVGPSLAQRLDQLAMPEGRRLAGKTITWFEVVASADAAAPRANAKVTEAWGHEGVDVTVAQVVGPPFWQVHERAVAPLLIEAGTAAVRAWPARQPPSTHRAPGCLVQSVDPAQIDEYPVAFGCGDDVLAGIVHRGASDARLGIVIVVAGGPQYRAGAHRQFVSMARMLAVQGYPVMRFDLRGMGDSTGEYLGYHHSRADIRAAIDELMRREPGLAQVALFGECESASGILFYASQDKRVRQIALANPWVRTTEVQAEAILKHYYAGRLMSREFWQNVLRGQYKVGESLRSFVDVVRHYWRGRQSRDVGTGTSELPEFDHLPLPAKTAEGLRRFAGPVLVLMSGRDLIAREFDEVTKSHAAWKGLLSDPRVRRKDIADADHTFSRPEDKVEAHGTLLDWLKNGSSQRAPSADAAGRS